LDLAFLDLSRTVAPGETAAFRFTLDGFARIDAIDLEVVTHEHGFDDSWCRTELSSVGNGRLIVDTPIEHALAGRTYHIELRATDLVSAEVAQASCRLSFERGALCVKFPKGRTVKARSDGSVVIKVPVLNCGPVKFDVSLDVRHKKGELLHVDYEGSVTVEAGELATIEATVHPGNAKPLTPKDVTVTAKCESVTEHVWPRRLWRVPAAVALALVIVVAAATYADAATHRHHANGNAVVSATVTTTPSTAPSTGATNQTSTAPLIGTSVRVASTPTPQEVGVVQLVAQISSDNASSVGGTVTFMQNSATLGSAEVQQNQGTLQVTLPPGDYMIVATYSGDHTHGSSRGSTSFSVPKIDTSVTIQGPVTSSACGSNTFTATVTPASSSSPVAGTVTFSAIPFHQTAPPMSIPVTADDTASWNVIFGDGPETITATYNGDSAHTGSTSAGYQFDSGFCVK
jgi:hypothetical protein